MHPGGFQLMRPSQAVRGWRWQVLFWRVPLRSDPEPDVVDALGHNAPHSCCGLQLILSTLRGWEWYACNWGQQAVWRDRKTSEVLNRWSLIFCVDGGAPAELWTWNVELKTTCPEHAGDLLCHSHQVIFSWGGKCESWDHPAFQESASLRYNWAFGSKNFLPDQCCPQLVTAEPVWRNLAMLRVLWAVPPTPHTPPLPEWLPIYLHLPCVGPSGVSTKAHIISPDWLRVCLQIKIYMCCIHQSAYFEKNDGPW